MLTQDFQLRLKSLDDAGSFSGFASTYGGPPDLVGDIIEPGAFAQSIAQQGKVLTLTPGSWSPAQEHTTDEWLRCEGYGDAGTPIRALMLARLGPNVWHDSPAAAMAVLEELEETARLMCVRVPPPAPLSEAATEELRRAFGARW